MVDDLRDYKGIQNIVIVKKSLIDIESLHEILSNSDIIKTMTVLIIT